MPDQPGESADLPQLSKTFHIQSRETSKEIEARLRRDDAEAEHLRWQDKFILRVVTSVVGVATALSVLLLLWPGTSPETVKWAMTLLSTIVAGGLGYMAGKSRK